MKIRNRNTPPPTDAEIRKHFEGQIPKNAIILIVPGTTIRTLADDTLLWDWRGGYAELDSSINDHKIDRHGKPIYCTECNVVPKMGLIQRFTLKPANK